MYEVKSQKILGSFDPVDGLWSIPYEYDPDDINVLNQRGRLYIVVDFEASNNIDLHLASKIIIDQIKESYYGDTDGTPLQAIEKALISGKDKLKEVAKGNESEVRSLKFNIACSVVWGKVLYVAQLGESAVLLVRNGEVLDIGHKTSGEVLTSSGLLEGDDVFILATKQFNESFNNDLLLEKLGLLEGEFKKSDSPATLSAVVVMFKKSLMPGKKDIIGIMSSITRSASDNKINVETQPSNLSNSAIENFSQSQPILENEPDVSSITTLTDIPSSANQDTGVSSLLVTDRPQKKKMFKMPNKKTIMFAGVGLLLVGFVFSSYQFFVKGKLLNKNETTIAVVDIADLNSKFEELTKQNADKQEFVVLLETVNKLISENPSSELKDLKLKIEDYLNKPTADSNDGNIFDFSVKFNDSKISNLTIYKDQVLVSDLPALQSYLLINDDGAKITDLPKYKDFLISLTSEDSLYILNSKSVFVGTSVDDLKEFSIDTEIKNFTDAVEYLGNLYVLSNGNVYKLVKGEGVFTSSVWASNVGDFNSLAIDGSIYLAGDSGVTEYYTGEKQDFTTKVTGAKDIYTTNDLDYAYVLTGKNLVKIDKSTGLELGSTDLTKEYDRFTILGNNAYLSSGSKLYQVDISK